MCQGADRNAAVSYVFTTKKKNQRFLTDARAGYGRYRVVVLLLTFVMEPPLEEKFGSH